MIKPTNNTNEYKELLEMLSNLSKPSNDQTKSDSALVSVVVNLLFKLVESADGSKPIHSGVKCGNCGTTNIRGNRFHCVNCVDFDLCESCERNSIEIHDKTHVFLKINSPLPLPQTIPNVDRSQALLPVLYLEKKKKRKKRKNRNTKFWNLLR